MDEYKQDKYRMARLVRMRSAVRIRPAAPTKILESIDSRIFVLLLQFCGDYANFTKARDFQKPKPKPKPKHPRASPAQQGFNIRVWLITIRCFYNFLTISGREGAQDVR